MTAMTHIHHAIDYIEINVTDLAAAKEFYAAAFGWAFNDYGPDYAGIRSPDGEGEVGGLNPGRAPQPGRAARAALLRRPRRHGHRGGVGGRPGPRGPLRVPRREEVPLH